MILYWLLCGAILAQRRERNSPIEGGCVLPVDISLEPPVWLELSTGRVSRSPAGSGAAAPACPALPMGAWRR